MQDSKLFWTPRRKTKSASPHVYSALYLANHVLNLISASFCYMRGVAAHAGYKYRRMVPESCFFTMRLLYIIYKWQIKDRNHITMGLSEVSRS